MKFISSRDNVRLKSLRALAEDTREQRRRNSTVLDGPHLVEAYFRQVGSPELVAISESGRDHMEIRELLAGFSGEILCFKDSLFREISGTASPVGIAAVIMIPAESSLPTQGDCIVLDAIQDAGNLGSILRSAAAAGVQDVVVGPGCAGPWTPRVLRAGQGQGTAADRGVLSSHLYSDGRLRNLLYVDGGPSTTRTTGVLKMSGQEIFKHAVIKLAETGGAALKKAGLAKGDINWLVPHQANLRIMTMTAQKLGVPMERVVVTVQDHGNTSAASIPLALSVARGEGRIRPGDLLLMEAIGGGLAWGASAMRW